MISPILPTYAPCDIAFERGEGAYLYTAEGRRYLDFASGIAVTALGHGHPALRQALHEQIDKVWHVSNIFRIPAQEEAARLLVRHTFADTVFFCNSGLEALEAAIKMARRYHAVADCRRRRIICCDGAFHGRSLATIAAAGQEKMLDGFDPMMPGFDHVPLNRIDALERAVGPDSAAILMEPIQGEGGIRVADPAFLRAARDLADAHDLVLIFDEVQSGLGRSGQFFAHQESGVMPDIVTMAKGLGGGFPVGACLATEKAARGMGRGSHGSTFGGNPLAMTVAGAVLRQVFAPGFLDRVRDIGATLNRKTRDMAKRFPKVIRSVRGRGLMIGLCVDDNRAMIEAMRERGLLSVWAEDNVVRWLPPLIIEDAHIDEAMRIMDDLCRHRH